MIKVRYKRDPRDAHDDGWRVLPPSGSNTWTERYEADRRAHERFGDGEHKYASPLDMAIRSAKTTSNDPRVERVLVTEDGEMRYRTGPITDIAH